MKECKVCGEIFNIDAYESYKSIQDRVKAIQIIRESFKKAYNIKITGNRIKLECGLCVECKEKSKL